MNKRRSTPVVEPRKEPKQERSRQTYQVILQGAIKVIRRDGLPKLSTNKVAEESGVSIGSLYQYFPSKQAIVAALIDQIFEVEYERIKNALASMSPKMGARQIVKNIFEFYYKAEVTDLAYRRALIESVSIVDKAAEALRFHRSVGELFISFVTSNYPGSGEIKDYQTMTFFIQYFLKAVAMSSVDQEVFEVNREHLIDELAENLMNLLKIPTEFRGALS
jgi:AcrR family transcriptional regulator